MSKLAEIQAAVESLSLEEMNAFEHWWHSQPGKPGARLKKLVSDAWAGQSEVPRQVTNVSDETLTDRAIERSRELIRERGWHV
ncbi:MAG: hypothetical protein WAW39_21315 [Prosthecobacter sp.]|uniref:hypothetical protein n=1 Tax=Prosthecobacter sp. TaxID=1965333 RepID=UPI003BAFCDC6